MRGLTPISSLVPVRIDGQIAAMALPPRIYVPGYPMHVVQRGNNRSATFLADTDRTRYLDFLIDAAARFESAVHAYVLMGNHIHLLITPGSNHALGDLMKLLGVCYVRHFNDAHARTGGLWEGRYKACLVDTDRYCLACLRYIDMNPVRAGLVKDPAEWRWSSYRHHASGEPDRVVVDHDCHVDLADSTDQRQAIYRDLVSAAMSDDELTAIREATYQELVYGPEATKKRLERVLFRRMKRRRRQP